MEDQDVVQAKLSGSLQDEKQVVERAWRWFESVGSPRYWVAPMVGQSELAYRMLMRGFGAHICSTEMIDAGGYAKSEKYRSMYPFDSLDRPLIVQLGGSDPATLGQAAALAAPHCDAVELNVGCPQRCARQGGYGSFLMDKPEHLQCCVESMASAIREANPNAACLVKIRCFEDSTATVELARMLVRAGCQCLTVHGRTRRQGGGKRTGRWAANWTWIRAVKEAVAIPVIANGNIRCHEDVVECLRETRADGVMSGCGVMRRPWLFAPDGRAATAALKALLRGGGAGRERAEEGGEEGGEREGEGGEGEEEGALVLGSCRAYLRMARRYGVHPRQASKHLLSMLPCGGRWRAEQRALFEAVAALTAANTSNSTPPERLDAIDALLAEARLDAAAVAEAQRAEAAAEEQEQGLGG